MPCQVPFSFTVWPSAGLELVILLPQLSSVQIMFVPSPLPTSTLPTCLSFLARGSCSSSWLQTYWIAKDGLDLLILLLLAPEGWEFR